MLLFVIICLVPINIIAFENIEISPYASECPNCGEMGVINSSRKEISTIPRTCTHYNRGWDDSFYEIKWSTKLCTQCGYTWDISIISTIFLYEECNGYK